MFSRGRGLLRLTLAAALWMAGASAWAIEIQLGPVEGNFDTVLTAGVSARMAEADPGLVAIVNGGTSRTANEDDGNLNYERGDVISTLLKATHDLALKYGDYGLLGRGTYYYDFSIMDMPVCATGSVQSRDCVSQEARDQLGQRAELLDLLVYSKFDLFGRRLNVRVGQQAVNWGESTFIANGINVINPVDVSRLRTPGSEIKEALLPTPIVWLGYDLTENLGIEALWLADYEETRIDPRGSFFSGSDIISPGGDRVFTGFGRRNDQHEPYAPPATPNPDPEGDPIPNPTAQVWIPRADDIHRGDERGQYGAAIRLFVEGLNNTEFGLFHLHYHNRTPSLSAIRGTGTHLANEAGGGGSARYMAEYVEGVDLFGLSYNTAGPVGIALQGEYSYRPNQPAQLAGVELLLAALGAQNNITGDQASAAAVPVGTELTGYRRVRMHQLQTTVTKAFGPSFGADQWSVVGEIGANHLELPDSLKFSGPGTALPAPGSANAAGGSFQTDGYATETSWGYRLSTRLDYENLWFGAQVSPRLVFSHDAHGVGPNFNQEAMAVSTGVSANYLQRWGADLGYTNFFGGRDYSGTDAAAPPPGQSQSYSTGANPLADRDFISLSISYAF